jgi:acyl-coenzyme A thioesterase 9
MRLSGKVTYVGTSSMEIRMQCNNSEDDEDVYWMEAFFTFVATDPVTKRPLKIPLLEPESELELQRFEAGKRRAIAKKKARQRAKKQATTSYSNKRDEMEIIAQELLEAAGPVVNMPSLACSDSILMRQTELENCEIAQPQTRNLASQIFGGFLMRRACELAYSTAYVFAGTLPVFYEVDEGTLYTRRCTFNMAYGCAPFLLLCGDSHFF